MNGQYIILVSFLSNDHVYYYTNHTSDAIYWSNDPARAVRFDTEGEIATKMTEIQEVNQDEHMVLSFGMLLPFEYSRASHDLCDEIMAPINGVEKYDKINNLWDKFKALKKELESYEETFKAIDRYGMDDTLFESLRGDFINLSVYAFYTVRWMDRKKCSIKKGKYVKPK